MFVAYVDDLLFTFKKSPTKHNVVTDIILADVSLKNNLKTKIRIPSIGRRFSKIS